MLTRRVVLQRGFAALLGLAGVGLVATALIPGDTARTVSIAIGIAIGVVFTATWLVGAALTFDRPWNQFGLATFGMWPMRALVAVLVVLGGSSAGLDLAALVFAWIAAQAGGFAIESWAFTQLAGASTFVGEPLRKEGSA